MIRLLRFSLLLLCVSSIAQGPAGFIPVHGTKILSVTGTPLPIGTLCAQLTYGDPFGGSANLTAGGQTTKVKQCVQVTNGAFTMYLPDTRNARPSNPCITIVATTPSYVTVLDKGFECVQPTSSPSSNWCSITSCDFDKFQPSTAGLAVMPGETATVAIGTVTTGPPGSPAAVSNAGTERAAILNFTIPEGQGGVAAATGPPGTVQQGDGSGHLSSAGYRASEVRTTTLAPLASYLRCVHAARTHPCNINIIGDSRHRTSNEIARLYGAGYSLPNDIPIQEENVTLLRRHLQAAYGDGGPGLVPLRWGVAHGEPNPEEYTFTATGSFTFENHDVGPYQVDGTGAVTDALLTHMPNGSSITLADPGPYSYGLVFCATTSNSGSFTVTADGVNQGNACPSHTSATTATLYKTPVLSNSPHRLTALCVGANGCWVYGLGGINATGVRVNNLSLGGASLEAFATSASQMAFADLMPGPVGLALVAHHSNEPGNGISGTTYLASLTNIMLHEQALGASMLYEAMGQDQIPSQAAYYTILSQFALANPSVSFLDMRDRWGQTFNPIYFGPDQFHENELGNREINALEEAALTDASTPLPAASVNGPACPSGVSGYDMHGIAICRPAPVPLRACPSGYSYVETRTIPHALVAENLVNFPVGFYFNGTSANSLIDISMKGAANGGKVLTASGADIVFCQSGVQLSHELVTGSYDPASGAPEFYVRFPSLSSTADTPFQVLVGNPNATDSSQPADVWRDYAAVYHLGSSVGSAFYADSTGNGNTLSTPAGGSVSGGAGHLGAFMNLTTAGDAEVNAPVGLPANSAPRTVEEWYKLSSSPPSVAFLPGYGLYSQEGNFNVFAQTVSGVPVLRVQTLGAVTQLPSYTQDTNWHFLSIALPPGGHAQDVVFNFDGVSQLGICPLGSTIPCDGDFKTTPGPIHLNGAGEGYPQNIALDELRYSSVYRSPGWLKTVYTNAINPAAFAPVSTTATIVSPQIVPAGVACIAATRGDVQYVPGAPGVADIRQTCVKDASDAYSWTSF